MFKLFKQESRPQEQESKSPEAEKQIETKVILEFMRHGEKENAPGKANEELRLTEKGKSQARGKGKEFMPQPEVSIAIGSPNKRAQETAGHVLMAQKDINPAASLEEMEEIISRELKIGKKITEDERLNYDLSGPAGKEAMEAYKKYKDNPDEEGLLRYLVNKSDQRAVELGDKKSSTYSKFAGDIAEMLKKYLIIGHNFNRIAAKTDKYEKFGNQLERYIGTHGGVLETFVAKVIEKKFDKKERDEFVDLIGGNMINEADGIHVEIKNKGSEQAITIGYNMNGQKGEIEIERELLDEFIKERNVLEQEAVSVA